MKRARSPSEPFILFLYFSLFLFLYLFLCLSGLLRNLTTRTTCEERTCCMREPVEKCPIIVYDTQAVAQPKRARKRWQAKKIARLRSSRCQGVNNGARDTLNELHMNNFFQVERVRKI